MEQENQEQGIPWEESPLYLSSEIGRMKEKLKRIENRMYPWYKTFPWSGYVFGFVAMTVAFYFFRGFDKGLWDALFPSAYFGLGLNMAIQSHNDNTGLDFDDVMMGFILTLMLSPIAWFVSGGIKWFFDTKKERRIASRLSAMPAYLVRRAIAIDNRIINITSILSSCRRNEKPPFWVSLSATTPYRRIPSICRHM